MRCRRENCGKLIPVSHVNQLEKALRFMPQASAASCTVTMLLLVKTISTTMFIAW